VSETPKLSWKSGEILYAVELQQPTVSIVVRAQLDIGQYDISVTVTSSDWINFADDKVQLSSVASVKCLPAGKYVIFDHSWDE